MNKIAVAVVATVFNGVIAANGFAAGELNKFACAAGPVSSSGLIGKILKSSGDVLYSGAAGYTEAKAGAKLVAGSQISTGEGSSAKISVGSNCNLPIGANSIATLNQPNGANGDILVSIENALNPASKAVQEGSSSQVSLGLVPLLTGATVAGPVAIAGYTASENQEKNQQRIRENNNDYTKDAEGNFIPVGGGTAAASQ